MSHARRLALPLIALVAGLIGTMLATLLMARAEQGRYQARFAALADGTVAAIQSRMLAQLTLLRGTAGFFNASEEVRRKDFRAYVSGLRLEQNYPGVLGIGFAAYAPNSVELDRIAIRAQREGTPQLTSTPPGARDGYSIILYLEPQNRLNAAALGFDMMSGRQAMFRSLRSGLAELSGRVRLVQEIEPVKQPGFLIYTPVFRGGRHLGWVYSPMRAYDLFGAIFAGAPLDQIIVEVFDEAVGPERLLYRSASPPNDAEFQSVRRLEVAAGPGSCASRRHRGSARISCSPRRWVWHWPAD